MYYSIISKTGPRKDVASTEANSPTEDVNSMAGDNERITRQSK